MRELEAFEIAAVDGGSMIIPLVVVGGVLGLAALGIVAYGAYKGCEASAEVSKDGIKVEIDCKPDKGK